jgi:hypothetical protein
VNLPVCPLVRGPPGRIVSRMSEHPVEPEPLARSVDLVVEPMGEELLVYDTRAERAHSLNPAAASVWRACDGQRDVEALARHCELDPVAVELALDSLRDCDLLIDFPGRRVSRRHALRAAAVAGAGIGVAFPVVRSIVLPTAAQAVSCLPDGDPCTSGPECCIGFCVRGLCGLPPG